MDLGLINTWHNKLDNLWQLRGYTKLNKETIKGLYEYLMLSTILDTDNLEISLLHASNEDKGEIIKSFVTEKLTF